MSSTAAIDQVAIAENADLTAEPTHQLTPQPTARPPSSPPLNKDAAPLPPKDSNLSDAVVDGQGDSEAETEILSQDHKEEAANGATIKHEHADDIPMIDAPSVRDEGAKFISEPAKSPNGMKSGSATRRPSEVGEIDREKARLSLQRTSSPVTAQPIGRWKSNSVDAPAPDVKYGGNDGIIPAPPSSRKRKARDDISPAEKRDFEPPRQRHKTDRPDPNHHPSSRERSPSPKKYPHRRTTSIQASLPNGQVQKKRRPPNLSTARISNYHEESESESSSDATLHPQAQPKRFSHRSVSTPGRAMAPRKKLKDRYGMTAFAIACQEGDLDRAKEALAEDPLMLDEPDNDQNTPLQSAALAGQEHIVEYLIEQHCNIHTMNRLQETPLIDAVENAEVKVVRLLLDAGVDPSRPNKKGRQPVDLVPKPDPDDEDEVASAREIRNLLKAAIQRNHGSNRTPRLEQPQDNEDENKKRKDLDILDRTTKNLRDLVENNDKYGVRTFLEAMVRVDNNCLVAAAKGGHTDLMNVLLPLVDPVKVDFTKPLLAAIGRGHIDIVELLLKQDLDPTLKSSDDKYYWEIAEERQGPGWQTERNLLKAACDDSMARKDKKRFKNSPESKAKLGNLMKREKGDKLLPGSAGPHEKRRHSSSSNVQRPLSPELTKPRRTLVRGKDRELSSGGTTRRRRVVDDEDESDEEIKSSPGRNKVGVPKRSSSPGHKRKERHTSEPTALKPRDEKPSSKHTTGDSERSRLEKTAHMKSYRKREAEDESHSPTQHERKRTMEKEQIERRDREVKEREAREKEIKEQEAKEAAEREAEERERKRLAKEASEREAAEKEKERFAKEALEREALEAAERERQKEKLAKEAIEREAAEQERQRIAREAAEREAEEARRQKAEAEAAAAAEKARQEDEERARRDAEQKAAEQRERAQRVRDRLERLSKYPSAITAACEFGTQFPLQRTCYSSNNLVEPGILGRFTPIFGVQGHEIGLDATKPGNETAANELWILNYQACALLGLSEIEPHRNPTTQHWRVQPSTREQRDLLYVPVNSAARLVYPPALPAGNNDEHEAQRARYEEMKQRWLNCDAIAWVRFADFEVLARQSPRLNVPGVNFRVQIRVHLDLVDEPMPGLNPFESGNPAAALAYTNSTTEQRSASTSTSNTATPPAEPVAPAKVSPTTATKKTRKALIELRFRGMSLSAMIRELEARDRNVPGVGEWRGGEPSALLLQQRTDGRGNAAATTPGQLSETDSSHQQNHHHQQQQQTTEQADAVMANAESFVANAEVASVVAGPSGGLALAGVEEVVPANAEAEIAVDRSVGV